MPKLFLSPHAYACETGGHAVFLDLKRDKYTALAPEDVRVLRADVQGWPSHTDPDVTALGAPSRAARAAGSQEILQTLVTEGLLTADPFQGKIAAPTYLDTPTATFLTGPRAWPQMNRQHLLDFVSAWGTTTLMLRALPIRWAVSRARRRKEREAPNAPPFDFQKAQLLTTIHFAQQPVFYSKENECLRDSLTLIEFLSRYQIYPTWVFGVRMQPFAAHAWVQHGPLVFADPLEHVKTFTPIMTI